MAAKHVTFWKMKLKPGNLDEMRKIMGGGADEARLKKAGWVASIIGSRKDSGDEIWGTVIWDNSDNYRKNAETPEQNAWFEKMRGLLVADPEWFDCDLVEERHA
jgi:quinol monooxygenase YgiN